MSQLRSAHAISPSDAPALRHQAELRVELLRRMLEAARAAPSLTALIEALSVHAAPLEQLGLHDEAARLRAFARAVAADVARLELEADGLSRLAAPPK